MPQPRCSPPICQRSAARQSRAGAVLPRGAAQTEPSPRSQSGGSDYCGAQELTAASCGNYCCDGEAAAALHRARRHGVRPRGGVRVEPWGKDRWGGRETRPRRRSSCSGKPARRGTVPATHPVGIVPRPCLTTVHCERERDVGISCALSFSIRRADLLPCLEASDSSVMLGGGGTARSCSRPSPIRAISTAHLPLASDPKAHPYSFGLICAPSPAGSSLPVCLHKDVRRKRSAPLGPALEHVCSKRLYQHRWGGIACPALLCSALLPGCSVCRAPSPSFLHTPSPSRAAQGRTLRCRFRSDTPGLRGKAIALREHCSLQHQQLSRLALLLGQFWKPSPSRVHFISEQINSRLFASNRVSASKPQSCS